MTVELIKQMMDACYLAKRARDLLPALPEGVQPSYIRFLDTLQKLEARGGAVLMQAPAEAGVIANGFAYLKGFALETIATAVLFSMVGYFNGSNRTVWVMVQGLVLNVCFFLYLQRQEKNAA